MDTHNKTEKKKVTAESPLSVSGVTLIPITETRIFQFQTRYGVSCIARKTPIAMLVVIHGEKKVYRATGEEMTLDELVKEYPETKESVEKL